MIALEGVRLAYPGFVLGPVDLVVDGRIIGVVGPNGAGKTTLLSIVAGVYERHDGNVIFDAPAAPLSALERRRRAAAGGLSDAWFGELGLRAHFRLFADACPGWDQLLAEELAERLRVPLDKPMKRLSTGTRAKAALAVAFARRPQVAIFDEPWSALDPLARVEFSEELLRAAHHPSAPATIFVSSHDLDLVDSVADRLLVLDEGRCRFFGLKNDARARAGLPETATNVQLYREMMRP